MVEKPSRNELDPGMTVRRQQGDHQTPGCAALRTHHFHVGLLAKIKRISFSKHEKIPRTQIEGKSTKQFITIP